MPLTFAFSVSTAIGDNLTLSGSAHSTTASDSLSPPHSSLGSSHGKGASFKPSELVVEAEGDGICSLREFGLSNPQGQMQGQKVGHSLVA